MFSQTSKREGLNEGNRGRSTTLMVADQPTVSGPLYDVEVPSVSN
jgi:hypothetical protein